MVQYARSLGIRFILLVPVFNKDGSHWGVLGGHFCEPPLDRGRTLQRVLGALADVYTAARGHYLAEQDLQSASHAAAESARAKGEFLANMSHEIRTPLNAVIGLADILRGLDASPEQVQYLDMIQHAGGALLSIINDVLDFSKIEAGQLQLDPVPVDLPALLNEVVDMMAYHAQHQGLELVYHLDPAARLRTELDAVRLKQVLINLLNNAIKFTEKGHVSLRVRLEQRDGRTRCRFDVADTGIGIPAVTQSQIFEKFTQADASHTRKYGGTGLGLAICRSLVGLMEGDITLKSRVGRGTLFTVTVPLEVVEPTDSELLPEPALVGRRFLAVMPSAAARESLATTLGELGLAGLTLDDPRDLPLLLAQQPADLVLADAQMDSLMLEQVRQAVDACRPAPPRILLCPLGDQRHSESLKDQQWSGFVHKPVRRPVIRRELLAILDPAGAAAGWRPPRRSRWVLLHRNPRAPGGGQHLQPEGGRQAAGQPGLRRHRGRERRTRRGRRRGSRVRSGAHGLPDAGDGRPGGHAPHPTPRGRHRAPAHRRHDRQRHERAPRGLPVRRHGRLRQQAHQQGHPAHRPGALGPCA